MALTIYREREAIPVQKGQIVDTNDILFDYKFLLKRPNFTEDMLRIIKAIDGSEQVADSNQSQTQAKDDWESLHKSLFGGGSGIGKGNAGNGYGYIRQYT